MISMSATTIPRSIVQRTIIRAAINHHLLTNQNSAVLWYKYKSAMQIFSA